MSKKMIQYILKRILIGVLLLIGVSMLIYAIMMLTPTDYIDTITATAVQTGKMTQDQVQALKELYGLADKSIVGIA